MKNIFLIISFIFSAFNGISQNTNDVEIEITRALATKKSELVLVMKIKNTGKDTVRVIRPYPGDIDKHYRFPPKLRNGEIKAPYTLDINVVKPCASQTKIILPPPPPPTYYYFIGGTTLQINPGETTEVYSVKVDLLTSVQFCKESVIEVGLTYEPAFEKLTAAQQNKLEQLKAELDQVSAEAHAYLEEIEWAMDSNVRSKITPLHNQVKSEIAKNSLSQIKVVSNVVPVIVSKIVPEAFAPGN